MVQYQMGAIFKEAEFRLNQVPKRYYKFTKLWGLNSKRLVEYILQDYKIKLKPKITPKFFLVYKLTETKNAAL